MTDSMERLRRLSRPDLVGLVADVWEVIGWATEVSPDPDDPVDVYARQPAQGGTNVQLVRVVAAGTPSPADLREVADALRDSDAQSGAVVSLDGYTDEAKAAVADADRLYLFEGDRVLSMMRNWGAEDLLEGAG